MPQIAITLAITAGGMALQYLLTPRPKQTPTDKGKLDDIRIIGSDYGAFIPWTSGKTRQSGNIVFSSGVDHYTVSPTQGGGKKSSSAETTHIYKTSVAVLITRSEIENFLRIWADSDLINIGDDIYTGIFEAEAGAYTTLSGGAAQFVDATASGGFAVNGLGNGGQAVINCSSVPDPPRPRNQDPDEIALPYSRIVFYYKCATDLNATIDTDNISPFSELFPATTEWTAKTVIVSGFANTVTFSNASAAAPDLDKVLVQHFWEVSPSERGAYPITGVVNPNIGYPTDVNDPSEYYNYPPSETQSGVTGTYALTTPAPGEEIRFYTGTYTQTADSKIKSWLDGRYGVGQGVLRASAMRGLSYVVFQDRTLKSNRIENFTFETDTGDDTLNTVLEHLFNEVGLSSGYYNITATSALTQTGYIESTASSRKQLLEALCRYHFFRCGEIDGKIKTIVDTFTSAATLTASQIRAYGEGEESPPSDAEVIIKESNLLPRSVRVSVMQPELEYHNESVEAQLFTDIAGYETQDYSFPIVDPASTARTVAEKLLLKSHAESTAYEFFGMPSTAKYSIGEVITVPIGGIATKMRIEKKQMTLPTGKVKFQCVSVNPFTPSYYADEVTEFASKAVGQFATSTYPRNSIAFVIPSDPIRDADKGRLGVYLALCGRGRGDGDSISLYRETAEDNYEIQSIATDSSPVGLCEDTLATYATPATEDTTNVVDIWFFDDVSLETVTADDIARSPLINLIRVGNEWLQVRTWTAQTLEDGSPYRSKWRASNLTRGLFGTVDQIATHASGELAAVVTPALMFYDLEPSDIGQTVNLKAVTNGQSVDLAPINSFTFNGTEATGGIIPLFDHTGTYTTTGTGTETAYINQIDAGTLKTDGDKIKVEYELYLGATATAKKFTLTFGGNDIAVSDTFTTLATSTNAHVKLCVVIRRASSTSLHCSYYWIIASGASYVENLTIAVADTALNDYDIELELQSNTAGNISALGGDGLYIPAASTYTSDIVFDGEVLTFGGEPLTFT